jgi:hypothetical protein
VSDDLHNANNALEFLRGKGIDTSVGRVFLASDVEAAVRADEDQRLTSAVAPKPKTMAQAKRMARADDELMKHFQTPSRGGDIGGPSISAGPDSSSRT